MRTPDGYYSCDRCPTTGLRTVFQSGGSDLCGVCRDVAKGAGGATISGDPPPGDGRVPFVNPYHVLSVESLRSAVPPAPEFLQIDPVCFVRVADVGRVCLYKAVVELEGSFREFSAEVHAPYFGPWLDRLGIPWTAELREAHSKADR